MQQEIMGSHVSPDLWISTEKKQDQQNSSTHFVRWSSAEKIFSAEIGPNIESAEVHYTKQKMSSARAMVWILRSAEIFFQQKSGTQFVQWSSAENQITLKSAKNCLQSIRGHRISIFRRFFSADLMPHNRPQKKKRKVRRYLFGKKIWDFNAKFCTVDPTLPIGVAHVIGRNLPG